MKKITKEYAESLADQILAKFNNQSTLNNQVDISLENWDNLTKETLVQTILSNDNIYVPFKRTIQFENIQDETVKNICNPIGEITMTETFNKGYTAEELLNTDLTSLDVHCEGINSKGYVSYATSLDSVGTSSDANKYYAVTYTGTSTDGENFSAKAIYNSVNPTQKEYYISKGESTSKHKSNTITSLGSSIKSTGLTSSKSVKIGDSEYTWNHYEGTSLADTYEMTKASSITNNSSLYSWKDSIAEKTGRIVISATCSYTNSDYTGVPVEFTVNDFSTGSLYKEENGVVKSATGSLSIVCKYNTDGNVTLEKPSYAKAESANIISTNLSKIDNTCIGVVSVTTNSIENSEEIVITPNYTTLKSASDITKIVSALNKWNIGLSSNATSLQGNNIWINTGKGTNYFAADGTYVSNNYVSLADFLKK